MVAITPTETGAGQEGIYDGIRVFQWAAVASGDTCVAVSLPGYADKSVQVTGNFSGTALVAVHGSNDGTNYAALRDPQGTTISIGAAGIKQVLENTLAVKPVVAAGDGSTALVITMLFRRK